MDAQLEIINALKTQLFSYKVDIDMWPVWHFHPEIDILLTLKDSGNYIIGDYMGPLHPGNLVMIGPNLPHAFMPFTEDEGNVNNPAMICLQFSPESLGMDLMEKPEMTSVKNLFNRSKYGLEILGETRNQAITILKRMEDENELLRFASLIELFNLLANSSELKPLASPSYTPSLNTKSVEKIDTIIQYIREHIDQPISLDDAASLVHMGSKSFSRFFKKNTGKTFVQYVNEIRIGEACKRLLNSELSITDIAFDVGYNTLSNFNRRFMEIKSMTPRDYRKKIRQDLEQSF